MSLSERTSCVIRGAADWQPLQVSKLVGAPGKSHLTAAAETGAEADIEAGIEARISAAFKEGLEEGQYQARAEAQDREKHQILSAQQRWTALLEGLAQGTREIEGVMADRLLDLTTSLAATIACREIVLSKDRIGPVLTEALKLITGACRQLEVTAHPSDCGAIETWLKPQCGDSTLSVRADPTLSPGGCLLRADDTSVDATLQTRIRRTLAALGVSGPQVEAVLTQALAVDTPDDAGPQAQLPDEEPVR
ncbi:MAG TPA: FliH/SctL family protein [Lautropia sp.]|jgi:flagellar assembly protein FliH|nr:FliH/SctL family protein [Lautropia sp.]